MNANSIVNSWAEVWTLFEQRCAAKRIKESTMNKYRLITCRFVRWADDEGIAPVDLQPLDVIRYTGNLKREDGKPYKQNTLRTHCRYLKTLLNFAADFKVIPERIKIEMPQAPEDEIKALNDEELESVLGYFDNQADKNPRDAAIVYLLKDSGIRASELLGLSWEDLEWDEERHLGTVNVTKQLLENRELGPTKNGKSRKAYFNSGTWKHLKALRRSYGVGPPIAIMSRHEIWKLGLIEPTCPVFLGHEGDHTPLGTSGLGYMLTCAGEELGIPLHPHKFRHTAGRLMTIAGMPPVAMMQILGHSSLAMVTRYSLLWGEDVEDLFVDKMNGNH